MPTISDENWFILQQSYVNFMKNIHFLNASRVLPSESALLSNQMEHFWNAVHQHQDLQRGYEMIRNDDNTFQYHSPALNDTVPNKPKWDKRDTLDPQTPAPAPAPTSRRSPVSRRSWLWGETEANPYVIE